VERTSYSRHEMMRYPSPSTCAPGEEVFLSATKTTCAQGSRFHPQHVARLLLPAVLMFMVLLFTSCASQRLINEDSSIAPEGFPNHSVSDILDFLPSYPTDLNRLYAEAQIALSSPSDNGRFSAKISYNRPDSMIVRVGFPLGIEGARVLIAGDSAYVYDRIENVVYRGSPERIAAVLPQAMAGTEIMELATGFETPDPSGLWTVSSDSLYYLLHSEDGRTRYTIDPRIWRVVSYRLQDTQGTILEQRWYMDFRLEDKILIPRRMTLSRPPEDTRLSMALRRIEINPERLTFDLDVKEDANHVYLGE